MKWFKHDADANRDPKLEKVLMKYGAEGYALYWLCIELIAAPIDKHNLSFELEHDAEILAHRLKMDSVRVEEIMRYMVEQRLFEVDQTTKNITCMKLAMRIEGSIIKNPELKQIQEDIRESGKIPDNLGQVRLDKNRLDIDIDKIRGRARKRAPQDYEPSDDLLDALCAETNLGTPDLLAHLREMKDHEFKTAKKDWDAVFRNWVRRSVKWGKENPNRKLTYAEQLAEDMKNVDFG